MSKTLPEALDAPRHNFDVAGIGEVSYYLDDGGAGRPLLLLHSINAAPSAKEVEPLFEAYRGQRPVCALELPGFGFSERPDIDYTPELYSQTLVEFCSDQFEGPVDVVALSTTAEFAARAAIAQPGLFSSLVLVSPTGMGSREPPSGAASDRLRKLFSVPVFSNALYRGLTTRASIRFFLNMSFEHAVPDSLLDHAWATARQDGARHAPFCFLAMKLFTPGALEKLYAKVEAPILVLYDKDPNINFDRLPSLQEKNAKVRSVRIAPTRGLPHWEQLEKTRAALKEFWDEEEGS